MKKIVLDISSWQKPSQIDYDRISKEIDGVILRAGYTGYGTGQSLNKDTAFEKHYSEFVKRGVSIGAYWYSCANSTGEGQKEAEYFYNIIKDKRLALPVYWDTEDQYHQAKVTKTQLAKVGIEFLDYLEKKGYYVGIYASTSWLNSKLDMNMLKIYDVWVAHYNANKPTYNGVYGMWQYTADGKLNGYSGKLDLNYMYRDYPNLIKNAGLNGYTKVEKADVKSASDYNGFKKKGDSYVYFRQSGTQAFEWQKIKGNWYYFRKNTGTMVTGFQWINNRWRYFDGEGRYVGDAKIEKKSTAMPFN
ncbi:GH25 family lysozyme [Helcococcus kunzii]|uniref:GH25 family lysozyme n=1 Tax=Helcococcus kunzii TaxID=40091 RepID=UPI0038A0808C